MVLKRGAVWVGLMGLVLWTGHGIIRIWTKLRLLRHNEGIPKEGIAVEKVENPPLVDIPTETGSKAVGNYALEHVSEHEDHTHILITLHPLFHHTHFSPPSRMARDFFFAKNTQHTHYPMYLSTSQYPQKPFPQPCPSPLP